MKTLDFDKKSGKFIRREEIQIDNTADVDDIKSALKIELAGIVRQVKGLKRRAEEIKTMLATLDEHAKSTIAESVVEEA